MGDHLGEYVDTAVSDDFVLCYETFEEEFEEAGDEPGCGGVVVVIIIILVIFLLCLLC